MPTASRPRQHPLHRQLHLGQQRRGVDAVQFGVQRVGEVHHRAGAQHRGLHRLLVDAFAVIEQRKLLLLRGFRTQLATQIAQRQVVEGEAALPGPDQVGGQRGVGADAVERPAPPGQVMDRQLGLVQGFWPLRVGNPGGQRRIVLGGQCCGVDETAVAVGGRDRQRRCIAVVGQMGAHHGQTCPATVGDVLGQPLRRPCRAPALPRARRIPRRPRARRRPACRTAGRAAPGIPAGRTTGGSGRGPRAASAACPASAPAARRAPSR